MLKNAFVGGSVANYGTANYYPASLAAIGFVDSGAESYGLSPSSPYKNLATDGKDLGADIDAIMAATANTVVPQAK
jgi:hypothetical protein